MNFVEPFAVFFGASAAFAESGTYFHAANPGVTISGQFWNPSSETFGIEGRVPKFETQATNVPNLTKGDGLVLSFGVYKIQDWEYDATGNVVTFDLELQ